MLNVFKISDDKLIINGMQVSALANPGGKAYFVDGDNGSDTQSGRSWNKATATIAQAVSLASANDSIYVLAKDMAAGATDPESYAETVTIPAGKSRLRLIGVSNGATQGGLPQMKIGAGSTAMLTVRAPGVLIDGIGFNGASSTGGGILLDDDASTKSAFGVTVRGCHFKNCKGHSTNGTLGGGVTWAAAGGAWQVLIENNEFYGNLAGVVLVGTSSSRPKDVTIRKNRFGAGAATDVDVYIYGAGGSAFNDVAIYDNQFTTVLPAKASGSVVRYMDLTGVASGIVANNYFAGIYTTAGFGAAKDAAKIPTAVGMPHNYSDSGLIVREA